MYYMKLLFGVNNCQKLPVHKSCPSVRDSTLVSLAAKAAGGQGPVTEKE